jgi:ABC-type phosphate transport system substrate-binding protein
MFGVPVTLNLRNALQAAQGLAVGSETEANMPSLTKSELRSLYTGYLAEWTQISPSLAPADPTVYIARRVSTSGTQKSAEVYWTFQNCNSGVATIPAGSTNTNACSTGPDLAPVFEGSGSGNVLTCMNNHNTGGRYAVGVLSMEFVPNTTTGTSGSGWRWIKVDGVAPTLLNAANGSYDFVFEASCNVRPTYLGGRPANTALFVNTVCGPNAATPGQLGNSDVIQAVNAQFTQTFGDTGLLGLVANPANTPPAPPLTVAAVADNPVWTFTRSGAGFPNSCQLPQSVAPVR